MKWVIRFGWLILCLGMFGQAGAQTEALLLFTSNQDGNREIYTMSADGSNLVRLTHDPAEDTQPAWSPDRTQIAFASNRGGSFDLYVMNADGSSVRQLTPGDGNHHDSPSWSPDGRRLVFVSDRGGSMGLHTVDISSGNITPLTQPDRTVEYLDPDWSPDGRQIVFVSSATGYFEINLMSNSGGNIRPLTQNSTGDNYSPVWSPDGSQIAFLTVAGGYTELAVMNSDGTNLRPITSTNGVFGDAVAWSPDGQHLAYVVYRPGENRSVQTIDLNGMNLTQLTQNTNEAGWPSWAAPIPIAATGEDSTTYTSYDGVQVIEEYLSNATEWQFEGQEDAYIEIVMESREFDTFLELYDPDGTLIAQSDDDGGGTNSRIYGNLPDTGTYTVVAKGYHDDARGSYTLTVEGFGTSENSLIVDTQRNRVTLVYGNSYNDYLENREHEYTFSGESGDLIAISIESSDFDTYVELLGPDGYSLASDDDGGTDTNSYLEVYLPDTGTYTILARAYSSGNYGDYYIRLDLVDQVSTTAVNASIAINSHVSEYLNNNQHRWSFSSESGQTVSISLESREFDTYLELYGPSNDLVAQDDDSGEDTNSAIFMTLPSAGSYTIVVRGFSGGARGQYTLMLETIETVSVAIGDTINGTLNVRQDRWLFEGVQGQDVVIFMRSDVFDTYLELLAPSGYSLATNDDSEGTNSRIAVTLPETGTYTILARGYNSSASGRYTLQISEAVREIRTIDFGETHDGNLNNSTDEWTFQGQAGQNVAISMFSAIFDTYLELYGPDGSLITSDDDSGTDYNALIQVRLPSSGTYTIIARSYSSSANGSYTISLSR